VNPSDPRQVVLRPVVTEKALKTSTRRNAYTFLVHPEANKIQIRRAIETLFEVNVTGVRTDLRIGKVRRVGWRLSQSADAKRAIVTLKEGQTIDVY
jgi:large subunit ribosomal protein L23